MKQLQPYAPTLQTIYARIKVKAVKEGALYGKYEIELKSMIEALDTFCVNCTIAVAEAEELKADDPEDEPLNATKLKLEAMTTTAEHHLGGAKGAKTRFSNL